jgi:hypothetical protein
VNADAAYDQDARLDVARLDQAQVSDTAPLSPDVLAPHDSGGIQPSLPVGANVGDTAKNFTIHHCDGTPFELHAQYDVYPAVVLLYNFSNFT